MTQSDQEIGSNVFWINGWKVEPSANRLKKDNTEVRLEPRLMRLLVCLAENQGQTVSREFLLDTVWDDYNVGLDTLNSSVSKLRKTLGDTAKEGKYIETIPKNGYRLKMGIRYQDDQAEIPPEVIPASEAFDRVAENLNPVKGKRNGFDNKILLLGIAVLLSGITLTVLFWNSIRPTSESVENNSSKVISPITSYSGIEVSPAFSRGVNDERIAFSWKGEDQDNWDIYVQIPGTQNPLRLTSDEGSDHTPAWSPDNRFIAFTRMKDGKCEIRQVPALGGAEKKLTDCSYPDTASLSWSFDGKWLAFPVRETPDRPFYIKLFSLETSESRALTSPPASTIGDVAAVFSPVENKVAYLRGPVLGVEDAWIVGIDGGEPKRLTKDNTKIHGIDWTPDGNQLVFSSNRSGNFSLWQISAGGGDLKWLGINIGDADAPTVSGDGKRIAYEQWQDEANIYQTGLGDTDDSVERIVTSSRWDWNPVLSPDGSKIAFISDRSGQPELWTADRNGRNLTQKTTFKGTLLAAPDWSPDGKQIVFDAREGGNADVWLVDQDNAKPQRITIGGSEEIAPSFSKDGRWIYFSSNSGGDWQIWKVSIDGGAPVQITKNGGIVGKESTNGKYVYFTHPQKQGIWQVSVGGGEETMINDELNPIDRNNWTVQNESIYFINRPTPETTILKRLRLATRQSERLREIEVLFLRSGISVSSDEKSVLFTKIDRKECDIVMIGQDN